MSSQRRILASRANGARSRGPVTAQGKARSSRNAMRHGLFSKRVVLANESPDAFEQIHDQFIRRFRPADAVEATLVEEMAGATWRLRRVWAFETRLFDDALALQPPGDELGRLVGAFEFLASRPGLALIHRCETRIHAIFSRALHNLSLLRASRMRNEPNFGLPEFDPAPAALPPIDTQTAPADPSGCQTNLGSY